MAENEYLDSSKAIRWMPVATGISNGLGTAELEALFLDCFFKTLRSIRRDHPIARLIRAVETPNLLDEIIAATGRTTDVTELMKEAALSHMGTQSIVERFLDLSVEKVSYDLPYIAANDDSSVNISEACRRLEAIRPGIKREIQRIAQKLTENPDWKPQRQKKEKLTTPKRDATKAMLTESLLAGIRK